MVYSQQYEKRIHFYNTEATSRGENRRRTLRAATTTYKVAGRNVNVTLVGKNNEQFEGKARKIFGGYIDQLYHRSGGVESGPECVILLGDLNTRISSLRYEDKSIPIRAKMFKQDPQDLDSIVLDNPLRNRIVEYGDNRVVLSRMSEINRQGDYSIGNIHKDIMRTVTDKELITWGNLVAVPDRRKSSKYESAGIMFLAAHGTGKTEGCITIVDSCDGSLVADDAVVIQKNGYARGTGYEAIYSFKEPFFFELDLIDSGQDPETSPAHAKYFLDKRPVPRHLPVKDLLKVAINDQEDGSKRSVSEIYNPEPVPVRTIVFQVPYDRYANLWFRSGMSPAQALENLEGKRQKIEYHKLSPSQRKDKVSQWFTENGDIDLSDGRSLLNLKNTYSNDELYKIFGEGWMWRHSDEYCCGKVGEGNSEMKGNIRQLISKAENFFVVGKNTPPKPSPRLSQLIGKMTSE